MHRHAAGICQVTKASGLLILLLEQRIELVNSAHHAALLVVHGLDEGVSHVRHQQAEAKKRVRLGEKVNCKGETCNDLQRQSKETESNLCQVSSACWKFKGSCANK